MSLLCWNCRELGNQQTKDQLAELVRAQAPLVVFLVETWTNKVRLELVQRHIDFKKKIEVPRGGGVSNFLEGRL